MKRTSRMRGSFRDLESRLQMSLQHKVEPAGADGEHRVGGHSRSALHRIFQELPADRVNEARELMLLPGYAELRPDQPRTVLDFYLRLPRYARAAVRKALQHGRAIKPRLLSSYRQRRG